MDTPHLLLIILWIGYCLLHSIMATNHIKNKLQKIMGSAYKFYRPLYAVFAALSLVLLLWFQLSMHSPRLFDKRVIVFLTGIFLTVAGLSIMIICINKYFYELSGLQAIQHSEINNTLQQAGLHKYVRHPLYLGTLLFVWGCFLLFPFANNLIAAVIMNAYVLIGIKLEEEKLTVEYGEVYTEYAKKVPKIFPDIFAIKKGSV